jgi:cytochrome oxidase assembly protein ShyY1
MKVGPRALIAIATILTLIFLRLGFWQIGRLHQRQALNAELASRAVGSPIELSQLPTDTAKAHYRHVRIDGTYDYANEIYLTLRSREGSPGINIVTPIRFTGNDTALLLVRGWVYSPDGITVDPAKRREPVADASQRVSVARSANTRKKVPLPFEALLRRAYHTRRHDEERSAASGCTTNG